MRALTLAATLALGLAVGVGVGEAQVPQPHMQIALRQLHAIQGEINAAPADKGGHRDNAVRLLSMAIGEAQAYLTASGPSGTP